MFFLLKPNSTIPHITGCILFLVLPAIFVAGQQGFTGIWQMFSYPAYWLFAAIYIFIYCLHSFVLLPKLFVAKKMALYILSVIVLLLAVFFLKPFDKMQGATKFSDKKEQFNNKPPPLPPPNNNPPPDKPGANREPPHFDIISIFLFAIIIALGMAIESNKRWRMTEQRAMQAETDKANAELSFLKAQINPHFLFNTLNNIYTLAVTNNENTAGSVMRLSNILRYVTDEVQQDFVPLQSEVECMNDYIELQRLRLSKKVLLDYTVKGEIDNKQIAPLILMCFAENVFKYGISNNEEAPLQIILDASSKDKTIFFCENKIFEAERIEKRTGIGIANAKKRLEHLYPNRHSLIITKDNGLFTVLLTLQHKQ
jgi:two-component system, LytTR family, sensor kinase